MIKLHLSPGGEYSNFLHFSDGKGRKDECRGNSNPIESVTQLYYVGSIYYGGIGTGKQVNENIKLHNKNET